MVKDLKFLDIFAIKDFVKKNNSKVVIWGTGYISDEVYNTFCAVDVDIYCYGDNNCNNWGKYKNNIIILSLDEIKKIHNIIVVIACFGYAPIYYSLVNQGIEFVYGLKDSLKYDYEGFLQDCLIAANSYKGKKGNTLIELYGNIGDTILQCGIVDSLLTRYGKDNVWLLFETEANADIYRLLAKNIIVFSAEDCRENEERRKEIVSTLNEIGFEQSIVLSDIRLYAVRRWLNKKTLINVEVYYDEVVPYTDYLLDMETEFIANHLQCNKSFIKKPNEVLFDFHQCDWKKKLSQREMEVISGKKIISFHMGATKEIRMYIPERTKIILEYIINKGFLPVLIGAGNEDELFWQKVLQLLDINAQVINLISRLNVRESLSVINESCFFVGTESGMWNASYVLNKPSIVIYGGGDYGNFKHISPLVHYVESSDRSCFHCKWYCDNKDNNGFAKCISGIRVEEVILKVDEVLEQINY